jgi:hypothetical protein
MTAKKGMADDKEAPLDTRLALSVESKMPTSATRSRAIAVTPMLIIMSMTKRKGFVIAALKLSPLTQDIEHG